MRSRRRMLAAAGIAALAVHLGSVAGDRVDVRRIRVPVTLEPSRAGGCERLDPAWVEVTEGGRPAAVRNFEPQRLPTVQAILLDVSPSMVPVLDEARRAVSLYVESLPDDEPVMLATFADRVALVQPPTVDREALLDALEHPRLGLGTRLWRAIDDFSAYLATRPERKVIVAVTDGCDSEGPRGPAPLEVIDRAARVDNLTVFPIGIDLPARCEEPPQIDPRMYLGQLASATGGTLSDLEDADQLAGRLSEIRARIGREGYVTYEPPEAPERGRDGGIRIRLRTRTGAPCAATLAGAAVRHDGSPGPADTPAPFRGGTADVPAGGSGVRLHLPPAPPFSPVTTDVDALLYALAGTPDDEAVLAGRGRVTDALDRLAAVLWEHPAYRAWARDRIRDRRLEEVRAVVGDDPRALAAVEAALLQPSWAPGALEVRAVLGAWLGDVEAVELAARVDGALAVEAWAGRVDLRDAEQRWRRVASALDHDPEDREPILMTATYDPAEDVVGFRRVLFPWISNRADDRPAYPERPLAAEVAFWVRTYVTIEDLALTAARHDTPARDDYHAWRNAFAGVPRSLRPVRSELRAVTLRFASGREQFATRALTDRAGRLVCWRESDGEGPAAHAFRRALYEGLESRGVARCR